MHPKPPPEILSPTELAYMSGLNERDRRLFLAARAESLKSRGLSYRKFSKNMGISTHTLQKGLEELHSGHSLGKGRVRRDGGGRHATLPQHPEWLRAVVRIIEPHMAGLPQDEAVRWVSISKAQIRSELAESGYEVSRHHVTQILDHLGLRERSFRKDIPMRDVKDRKEQFENIASVRKSLEEAGIPVISIDTKKKEPLGNFKRPGKALSNGSLRSYDHDFGTFSNGTLVPHGIYDVTRNVGYMTMGISHGTSEFVCENIERVWNDHLRKQYPNARTIAILCDGGGSNSSSHKIVKQDLMNLADRLNMRLLVMHYPPYCSKFNPIEHRLFSQITRGWNGAPLMSVEDAVRRAEMTTTKPGLKVYADINTKTYEIKRSVDESYERRLAWQVVQSPVLPKWNYLIKPNN